jgi:RNA polymerase sigma factor (sigma-70 family)
VTLFRNGNNDAFRVIYDRYRQRLFAYTRQMLRGSRQDAEDALQDVFVRAYRSLRTHDRDLALRAWLYRVAHNRCVDELRRPPHSPAELIELAPHSLSDPIAEAEQREALRRLIADVRELPDQQRSALLMRELSGMSYNEVSAALGVSVGAVKSLLVRARVGLAEAAEAHDVTCAEVREELAVAHDRRTRSSGLARRHMHECRGCREFRSQLRGTSKQLAALCPSVGPLAALAKLLGVGGGAATSSGSGAAAGGGAAAIGLGSGGVFSIGALTAGAGHITAVLAAAVITAGGAVEIQHTLGPPVTRHAPAKSVASSRRQVEAHKSPAALSTKPRTQASAPQSTPSANVSSRSAASSATQPSAPPVRRRAIARSAPQSTNSSVQTPPDPAAAPVDPTAPASQPADPQNGEVPIGADPATASAPVSAGGLVASAPSSSSGTPAPATPGPQSAIAASAPTGSTR